MLYRRWKGIGLMMLKIECLGREKRKRKNIRKERENIRRRNTTLKKGKRRIRALSHTVKNRAILSPKKSLVLRGKATQDLKDTTRTRRRREVTPSLIKEDHITEGSLILMKEDPYPTLTQTTIITTAVTFQWLSTKNYSFYSDLVNTIRKINKKKYLSLLNLRKEGQGCSEIDIGAIDITIIIEVS